ncbi:MAG TPA: hypothetical protein VJY54_00305 [Lachnospiraceae bacterium]|nr:hypothetical protein [Lachnospiraceae bacterium]
MMASAATKGACNHPNRIDKFRVIDHWSGFHMVLLQSSQGEVRCDYGHEVVEMTNICQDCGAVFRLDHIHHERHTVCGINY